MSDLKRSTRDPDLSPTRVQPLRRGNSKEPRVSPHRSARSAFDPADVLGWGADLDHANRPAVPMERPPPRLEGLHWEDPPEAQKTPMEILVSAERPTLTPVFGTSTPPSGLSGWIRRRAFHHSENNLRHWLMLMMADRVNVVEGYFHDARKGGHLHAIGGVALGLVGLMYWWHRR